MADSKGAEGEISHSISQDSSNLSVEKPTPRYAYSVALLADEGVELDKLAELISGGGAQGIQLLTTAQILAADDDPELAEQAKALGGEVKPSEELLSRMLKVVMDRPAPVTPADPPVGNSPEQELLSFAGGPRLIHVCTDLVLTEELARTHVDGGFVDAVILCTVSPLSRSGTGLGEDGSEEETDPAVLEEKKNMSGQAKARQALFKKLKEMAALHPPEGDERMAGMGFGSINILDDDPQQALTDMAKLLCVLVKSRIEYFSWTEGVPIRLLQTQKIDRRHYDRVLSSVPHSCLSLPIIMHALVEQVVQQAGGWRESTQVVQGANEREILRTRKHVESRVESALRDLHDEAPKQSDIIRAGRGSLSIFHHGDEATMRFGEPTLAPTFRESLQKYEGVMARMLGTMEQIPALHPEQPALTAKEAGLEMTELMSMAPSTATVKQVRRGLILSEFERMVGYQCGEEGKPLSLNAWVMDEIALHEYTYYEEHSHSAMMDVLSHARRMDPEVCPFNHRTIHFVIYFFRILATSISTNHNGGALVDVHKGIYLSVQ